MELIIGGIQFQMSFFRMKTLLEAILECQQFDERQHNLHRL